jgi:hypothetical protein
MNCRSICKYNGHFNISTSKCSAACKSREPQENADQAILNQLKLLIIQTIQTTAPIYSIAVSPIHRTKHVKNIQIAAETASALIIGLGKQPLSIVCKAVFSI